MWCEVHDQWQFLPWLVQSDTLSLVVKAPFQKKRKLTQSVNHRLQTIKSPNIKSYKGSAVLCEHSKRVWPLVFKVLKSRLIYDENSQQKRDIFLAHDPFKILWTTPILHLSGWIWYIDGVVMVIHYLFCAFSLCWTCDPTRLEKTLLSTRTLFFGRLGFPGFVLAEWFIICKYLILSTPKNLSWDNTYSDFFGYHWDMSK